MTLALISHHGHRDIIPEFKLVNIQIITLDQIDMIDFVAPLDIMVRRSKVAPLRCLLRIVSAGSAAGKKGRKILDARRIPLQNIQS